MALQLIKLLLLSLLLSPIAWATDYYVATTGSDSNAGTVGSPFLTIQKGVDSATTAGDRVLVNDGIYTSGFTMGTYDGSAEATKNITGITRANPAVVTVASHGYSNGDRIEINGLNDPITNGMVNLNNQWYTIANVTTDTFELSGVDSTDFDTYVTGGTVARVTPITVKAINPGNVTIDASRIVGGWSSTSLPANTYASTTGGVAGSSDSLWKVGNLTLLRLRSSVGSVTSEGDYYYNSSTGVFTIYTTSNPNLSVYRQLGGTGIAIKGVSYNEISDLIVQYYDVPVLVGYASGFPTPAGQDLYGPTSHNRVQNCTAQYAGMWGMAVQTADTNLSSYNTFDNLTIQYVDEKSGGQNGHCFKNAANHNADNGSFNTISNSTIHDCKYHGIQSSNAWMDNFFYGNRIYNTSKGGSGSGADIRCGWSGDAARPMACRIFDNNLGGGSGGTGTGIGTGIYIQDTDVNTKIWRNNIHDHSWHGIYIFYAGSGPTAPSNLRVWNNLIWNNKTAGIRGDSCLSAYIYNNSFYNNGEVPLSGIGAGLSLNNNLCSGITFQNNIVSSPTSASIRTTTTYQLSSNYNLLYTASGVRIIWNGTTYTTLASYSDDTLDLSGYRQDGNSVVGDPLYASPSTGDFRIPSPTTPADSIGTDLSASIPTDYEVNARQVPFDVGAYNTQGNLIVAPSIALSSYFPGRVGTATFGFATSSLTINNNYKIVLTFPAGFTISSGGTTVVSASSGFDGTFSTSVAGQVVTVTRNGDGTNTSPSTFSITLNFIKNPTDSGTTGTFGIAIQDNSGVEVGESNSIAGVIISSIAPDTLEGLTISGARI